MWDIRRRMLVPGGGVLLAAGLGLYYWKAAGLTIATVLATVFAGWQVYQGFRPQVDKAAERLRGLVEENWGLWRGLLLGDADPANVEFARNDDLRLGRAAGALAEGQLTGIYFYYDRLVPARLVILGPPGSGKTLLAVELALELLKRGFRSRDEGPAQLAVPVSVAGWTGDESLEDWLVDRLAEAYHLPLGVAAQLVESRRILPVLDGLDEIAQDPERGMATVELVLSALNTAYRGTDLPPVVITCRDHFYEDLHRSSLGVRNATVVKVKPLASEQVAAYIEHRFLADQAGRQRYPDWERLHDEIDLNNEPELLEVFQSPWLMTLATAVCASGIASLQDLENRDPEQLRDLLVGEFIPAAVILHPKNVGRRQMGERQLSEKYRRARAADRQDPVRVRNWLGVLARHLSWQADHKMSPADLQPDRLWLIAAAARKPVRVVHTTIAVLLGLLVGSLAAEFTGGIPGVITTCLTMALGAGFGLRAGLWKEPSPSRLNMALTVTSPPWWTRLTAWLRKPPAPSQVNIPQALTSPKWAGLIVAAGAAAAVAGTLDGGIKVGITEALAASLAACVLTGLSYGTSHAVTPNEPLTNDLTFGLVLGGVAGIATGLPGGLTGGLAARLHLNAHLTVPGSALLAIAISLMAGVALGSRMWLRYAIALAFLARQGILPGKCRNFLDWAATAGLLRISGIAYQFRHDDLRKHLDP
jgi:NACHT domain-containing protein